MPPAEPMIPSQGPSGVPGEMPAIVVSIVDNIYILWYLGAEREIEPNLWRSTVPAKADCPGVGIRPANGQERTYEMDVVDVMTLGRNALLTTLLAAAPMLLTGMAVGLIISIFQSVTQIQEITLTFVPKIVVVMVAFVLFLPWIESLLMGFVQPLFANVHTLVR